MYVNLAFNINIISAERCPLRDIGQRLPQRPYCTARIHLTTFTRQWVQVVGGRPTHHLPVRVRHSRIIQPVFCMATPYFFKLETWKFNIEVILIKITMLSFKFFVKNNYNRYSLVLKYQCYPINIQIVFERLCCAQLSYHMKGFSDMFSKYKYFFSFHQSFLIFKVIK